MKKICFVTTISATLKLFVVDTAIYLHEKGDYEITFICDLDDDFVTTIPDYINYIPVPMKRGISLSGVQAILKLRSIFKKEKFDMVQYSTPNAACYASIAAMLARVPVRLYCQWGIVYVGFSGLKRNVFKALEKMICSLSTWVEPDSFGNLKFSREEGLYTEKKSSVIWKGSASGVDLTKFELEHKAEWRKEIRTHYGVAENTFIFGFVGKITRDKGVNELFAVCQQIFEEKQAAILMLIGDMEKTESINVELYQWSLKEKRVIYCGRTNEVEKYLSAMDVFILPSYREGFGSAVIEAEAMAVPVIVTDIPGPTEAMLDGETGVVVKKADFVSLKTAMISLMEDSPKRLDMGNKGHIFASNNFESLKLMDHILQDRDRLLENSR